MRPVCAAGAGAARALYQRWIDTPHGSGPIAGVTATVDSQISSRITATRLLAIGVFALAAKKQTGALYLQIDGPEVTSVIECPPSHATAARQYAVKITAAGKAAARDDAGRPGAIAAAQSHLAAVEADTRAVEAARANLARVQADRALAQACTVAEGKVAAATARVNDARMLTDRRTPAGA